MISADIFGRQLVAWGVCLDPGIEERLQHFARLLSSYDEANVIGTKAFDQVLLEHVLDSMSCLLVPEVECSRVIADVGSGGGLPGLPLAIALPDTSFELIESTGKKATFLKHAVERFRLSNVEVINARAEDVARDQIRRAAKDVCTVRAVAKLSVLAEYCLPLLKEGGRVIAMKGHVSDEEREEGNRAASVVGGGCVQTIEVPMLEELEQKKRSLVVFKKVMETPESYPRRSGVPAKNPLGRA